MQPSDFFFDKFAAAGPDYDAVQLAVRNVGPANLYAHLRESVGDRRFGRALDVGCGTGLFGALLRDVTDVLVGIDGSAKMIAEARKKKIYDELVTDDLMAFLSSATTKYDLVAGCGVLIFFSDLGSPLRALSLAAEEDGIVAFNVDAADEDHMVGAPSAGNAICSHSALHVRRACDAASLEILALKSAIDRNAFATKEPILGTYVVARRM